MGCRLRFKLTLKYLQPSPILLPCLGICTFNKTLNAVECSQEERIRCQFQFYSDGDEDDRMRRGMALGAVEGIHFCWTRKDGCKWDET